MALSTSRWGRSSCGSNSISGPLVYVDGLRVPCALGLLRRPSGWEIMKMGLFTWIRLPPLVPSSSRQSAFSKISRLPTEPRFGQQSSILMRR